MQSLKNFKVGQEVVVMYMGSPLRHNSQHSPKHPCRGIVTKIGRKWLYVESTGAPIKTGPEHTITAHPVGEAKTIYRKAWVGTNKTEAEINKLVDEL